MAMYEITSNYNMLSLPRVSPPVLFPPSIPPRELQQRDRSDTLSNLAFLCKGHAGRFTLLIESAAVNGPSIERRILGTFRTHNMSA